MPHCIHLSPTSIADFKRCSLRWKIKHRLGVRQADDSDIQRMGTNWHAMHELYQNCLMEGQGSDKAFDAVIEHLNQQYAEVPPTKTAEEWLEERTVLATCFAGYCWYYQNDPLTTVATELKYELPLHEPQTGMPLPKSEVIRRGIIDRIVKSNHGFCVLEYKSTGKSIDGSSSYWDRWTRDTQFSMYALTSRELFQAGELPGCESLPSGVLLDVWKRPTVKLKTLSQKDSAAFLETSEYFGTKFEVEPIEEGADRTTVDGVPTDVTWGKSGKAAIRETPEMFGARLLFDIYNEPDKYFARKLVARTDADLRNFRSEIYSVYQTMRFMDRTGHYFLSEHGTEGTFTCPYLPYIHQGFDFENKTPPGFYRLFEKESQ